MKDIMHNSESEYLSLRYAGEGIVDGRVDALEISKSIGAFATLISEANSILNPNTRIKVDFADAHKGSWEGFFVVELTTMAQQGLTALGENKTLVGALSLAQLLELLGLYPKEAISEKVRDLIQYIRFLENRSVTKISSLETGEIELELENDKKLIVDEKLFKVASSKKIKQQIKTLSRPVKSAGITSVEFKQGGNAVSIVDNAEVDVFYKYETPDFAPREYIEKTFLEVKTIDFEFKKCRFANGELQFTAPVLDTDFISKIKENKNSFFDGDTLFVDLRVIVTKELNKEKTVYEILRVRKHIHPEANEQVLIDDYYQGTLSHSNPNLPPPIDTNLLS